MFKFSMLYCGICRSDYRQVRNEQSSMPIIDTVSAQHHINIPLQLLRPGGNMTLQVHPTNLILCPAFNLLFNHRCLSGSLIGSKAETLEMLDFCGRYNITADVEIIPIQKVNKAYE